MNISSGASILVSTKPEKERRDKRIQVSILGGTAIDSHPDAFLSLDTTDQPAAPVRAEALRLRATASLSSKNIASAPVLVPSLGNHGLRAQTGTTYRAVDRAGLPCTSYIGSVLDTKLPVRRDSTMSSESSRSAEQLVFGQAALCDLVAELAHAGCGDHQLIARAEVDLRHSGMTHS